VSHRAAHPVELGHHQLVVVAHLVQTPVPLHAAGELPGRLVDEHPLIAARRERIQLASAFWSRVDTRAYPMRTPAIVSETPDRIARPAEYRTRLLDDHRRERRV